tara:strand:- start:597 stop:878 length:282 start_codon:yes stop_codon:yes gene_type:complete
MTQTYFTAIPLNKINDFIKLYEALNIKIPFKYIEKGLFINLDEDFEDFINHIKDVIVMSNINGKTKDRYLKKIIQQEIYIKLLFDYLPSIIMS